MRTWKSKSDEEKEAIAKKMKKTKKERHGNECYVNAEQMKITKSRFSVEKKKLI